MNLKSTFAKGLVLASVGAALLVPATASADWRHSHRDNDRAQWRDLAIGAGIIGVLGAVSHNDTVAAIGLGGALYSGYRYEELCDDHGLWYHVDHGHRYYDSWYRPSHVEFDRFDHRSDRGRDWDRHEDRGRDRHDSRHDDHRGSHRF